MLPVYKAIDVLNVIPKKYGHTMPWVITANTPEGIRPFVVKLYKTDQIEARNSVTAEIICNKLAQEFDLHAPEAALIEFTNDFIARRPEAQLQQIEDADERLKFATAYIDGFNRFDGSLPKQKIKSIIDIDTLYAFDNFVRNGDRGDGKPNLLLTKQIAWLIDHELALDIDKNTIQQIKNGVLEDKFATYHIFRNYLVKSNKRTKNYFFETFTEYLRLLNLNKMNPVFDFIEGQGYETNRDVIMGYFDYIKQNSANFVTLLRSRVQ